MDQDIKSRPVYAKLQLDPAGLQHLIVTNGAQLGADIFAGPFDLALTWCVNGAVSERSRCFHTAADLLAALPVFLRDAGPGLRIHAAGTEAFIWDVAFIAAQAGMGDGEVFLCHAGSLCRRVYCVHCKAVHEDVQHSLVTCSQCQAVLFVRDHFSRRLRAFMGVKADVETPGELPPLELLYP
jgi:hypothetical protein